MCNFIELTVCWINKYFHLPIPLNIFYLFNFYYLLKILFLSKSNWHKKDPPSQDPLCANLVPPTPTSNFTTNHDFNALQGSREQGSHKLLLLWMLPVHKFCPGIINSADLMLSNVPVHTINHTHPTNKLLEQNFVSCLCNLTSNLTDLWKLSIFCLQKTRYLKGLIKHLGQRRHL